jgi:3-phenylpropionate/trans-cinnamate dioxygenase ferredoxin reductase subunit
MTEQFVIVGGGLAGAKAVETLRAEGFGGSVVLIAAEVDRPYERPPLSKGYLLGKDPRDNAFVHPSAWYGEQGIDLRTGTRVVRLQPGAHEVELDTGERLPYTKLLLATGSYPRKLDVEGANLTGVTYLRRLGDSDRLRSALTEGSERRGDRGGLDRPGGGRRGPVARRRSDRHRDRAAAAASRARR